MALAFHPQIHPPAQYDPYGTRAAGARLTLVPAVGSPTALLGNDGRADHSVSAGTLASATYWRRRVGLLVAVLAATYLLWLAAAAVIGLAGNWMVTTAAATDTQEDPLPVVYVVAPGDTLWSVAGELDSSMGIRDVVAALADANGGPTLFPGQTLDLRPAYSR